MSKKQKIFMEKSLAGNLKIYRWGIWAIPKEMQSQIPPHWMSYVLVENLEKSLTQVTKLGGKIVRPATDAGDFGIFAIISDPTGAMIALWENKPH
jgi:predicted enzyme related to lactoylglutathione lyase